MKKKIREVIVVEGRYDNTLSQVVDAVIVETGGFSVFHNKEKIGYLRRLARERGLILMTDPDGAGFVIRNYLKGALPKGCVKQAYVPDIAGKERRKRHGSKEGKLGVEGMRPQVILDALRRAGATFAQQDESEMPVHPVITKADFYEWGLSGRPDSTARRAAVLHALDLPAHMTANALLEFINAMEVREDDEEYKNPVDRMFEELEAEKPNHFAVRQYKKYSLAAGKTAKSILVSCGARLAPFDIAELREITMYDELELDTLGDKIFVNPKDKKDKRYYKTALFLIMSDTDSTFNFLISMIYTQLFNLLCEKADDVYGGRLPVHVRCLIDEAANIGQIPNLEKLVATIRSREISACLVLQAQSQLKALYKDNADTIIGNMDSRIFLGGSEPTTLKELNQSLGKETIDTFNTGESRGREVSHSLNYQKLGKDLATIDELAVLDGGKCILQLRGVRPFLSDKFDITKHPNYKYLSDASPKNNFDIEKYLSTRLKTKPDDVYEVYEVDASDESATA